jgi:GNAT superfamily N-acetyltransferase
LPLTVTVVDDPPSIDIVRVLMREYGAMSHIAGRWNSVESDLAALPGEYARPFGALFLARYDGAPAGCAALRRLESPGCSELKRMYVRPDLRGQGLGEALVYAVRAEARRVGYTTMRLDTAPELHAAIALYRRLGFVEIPPYAKAALPTLYFECVL